MKVYSKFTDKELIEELRTGSHDAFNEIHHQYYALLVRYAFNIFQDKEACRDMVQDVLVWFWEHRQQHQVNYIKGYLLMAIKYQVANYIRKGKVRENFVISSLNVADYVVNEESLELQELQAVITSFIHQLPEKCAEIFRLSREEHLTNKQIAAKLGISEVTVAVQIKRALDKLKVNLGKMHFWMYFFV